MSCNCLLFPRLSLSVFCNLFSENKLMFPQHSICENSLRLRLQVHFSRDLFPSALCLRHNQPGLQLIFHFPPEVLPTTHSVRVQATDLCEDIHLQDRLWKSISHSESRVETVNVLCHPQGLFLPPPCAEAMVLWILISCRLGESKVSC